MSRRRPGLDISHTRSARRHSTDVETSGGSTAVWLLRRPGHGLSGRARARTEGGVMVRKVMLSLLAVVVAAFAAHAGSVHGQAPMASLTVTVGMRSPNGASSGLANGPTATLPLTPVGGVEVLAMTPGGSADSPAASAITDGDGNATLDLTPGTYWVFVARADPPGS